VIAEQWKLPPVLSIPVAQHHSVENVKDPSLKKLAEVVELSGRCADVFVDEEAASAINAVRTICRTKFKMSDDDADALLADIGKRTKEVASLFEINIGSNVEYEAILNKANEALVELTLQSHQQNNQLQQQNQQLKHQATTDGLTGLANRARFEEFFGEQFTAMRAAGKSLSLLMIDVDKFKSINDKSGHPAGDQVLRVLGKLLKSAARQQDLAARYGGEEMCLILPGTTRATASAIAETIRKAIQSRPVEHDGKTIPVTVSIGVASLEPGSPISSTAQLIKAADLALYNAKHSGRNCVKVFSLKPAVKTAA
jgi:diguanylate cyclase (GGDEF)-like protein